MVRALVLIMAMVFVSACSGVTAFNMGSPTVSCPHDPTQRMTVQEVECAVNALTGAINKRDEASLRALLSQSAFPDERTTMLQMRDSDGEVSIVTMAPVVHQCIEGEYPCATVSVNFSASTTEGTKRWTRHYHVSPRDGGLILVR